MMGSDSRGCLDSVKYWLFAPCADDEDEPDLPNYSEKRDVYSQQPRPTSPIRIRAAPVRPASRGRSQQRQWPSSREDDMGWWNRFILRRRSRSRRPLRISHPTNFQHTGTGAINFRTSAQSFRPLQLSIYESDNRGVSPLLPYFIGANPDLALPEPARTRDVFDDDEATLHSRSQSTASFHIPRRPVGEAASFMSSSYFEDSPPRIPPRAKTRPRAHTYASPSVEAIVERIASAIIEKEMLDVEIHSIKSRASMCLSRPSTSYDPDEPIPAFSIVPPTAPSFAERVSIDRPRTAPSTQSAFRPPPPPKESAPAPAPTPAHAQTQTQTQTQALPPRRTRPRPPPFPERRSSFKAPQWKPNQPPRSNTTPETPSKQAVRASAFNSHPPLASPRIIDNSIDYSVPLAPPLPLILRPPLRKKKSFSRVSDWLFPADKNDRSTTSPGCGLASFTARQRAMSVDSVTNAPRALKDSEGFYQTLPPSALFSGPRRSFDSASERSRRLSGSIYSTDEEQTTAYGGPTTAATSSVQWSPGSTPPEEIMRQADCWKKNEAAGLNFALGASHRAGTFGSSQPSERGRSPEGVAVRRVPMHARQASLPAPRPTSVGVAF